MSTDFSAAAQHIIGAGGQPAEQSFDPGQAGAEIGAQAAAQGYAATSTDENQILAYLHELEARVRAVEAERDAERKAASQSGVTQIADNIQAQLVHRHKALGAHNPVLRDAVELAGKLAEAAAAAAERGVPGELLTLAGALAAKLARVATAASAADVSYPLQLLTEDLPEVAADLRPAGAVISGQVLSSQTAPPRRSLYAPV